MHPPSHVKAVDAGCISSPLSVISTRATIHTPLFRTRYRQCVSDIHRREPFAIKTTGYVRAKKNPIREPETAILTCAEGFSKTHPKGFEPVTFGNRRCERYHFRAERRAIEPSYRAQVEIVSSSEAGHCLACPRGAARCRMNCRQPGRRVAAARGSSLLSKIDSWAAGQGGGAERQIDLVQPGGAHMEAEGGIGTVGGHVLKTASVSR